MCFSPEGSKQKVICAVTTEKQAFNPHGQSHEVDGKKNKKIGCTVITNGSITFKHTQAGQQVHKSCMFA